MNRQLGVFLIIALLIYACKPAKNNSNASQTTYEKTVVQIPMRDGVKLNTEIYRPANQSEDLPIIITRTPYGQGYDSTGIHSYLTTGYKELADENYIFVFQDIRGRYDSEGTFVMMRPARDQSDTNSIDESSDAFDTMDWLINNVENHNGKIGMLGISYGGWLTAITHLEPHPALTAISPQASPADLYLGDDLLHNGAFRLSPSFGYAALMESAKTNAPYDFDQLDTYEFFLDMGPLSNANDRYFQNQLPSWNNFMEHPNYDQYWQDLNVDHNLNAVRVPTLNVAGWWDAEDFYGPLKVYEKLEQFDENDQNFLVVGPWRHGGWSRDLGDKLGEIEFGQPTSTYFKEEIQAKWFAHHLKGKGSWEMKEAQTFQTGSNQWQEYDEWPPIAGAESKALYFHPDGLLSFDPPKKGGIDHESFVSDPSKPVPYMPRPIRGFWQHMSSKVLWKVTDQRFAESRPDVLTWKTTPLTDDVTISGEIMAKLFASTTGTDCDWVVKLIDVYPEDYEKEEMSGYQLMVADEVIRAKFRNSFADPEPVPANQVVAYDINLLSKNHTFNKGHQIMVQVQSSWFPLIDRNPQQFIDIPKATAADYIKAEQRVFFGEGKASRILVGVR